MSDPSDISAAWEAERKSMLEGSIKRTMGEPSGKQLMHAHEVKKTRKGHRCSLSSCRVKIPIGVPAISASVMVHNQYRETNPDMFVSKYFCSWDHFNKAKAEVDQPVTTLDSSLPGLQ